jgi:hypothetical protein
MEGIIWVLFISEVLAYPFFSYSFSLLRWISLSMLMPASDRSIGGNRIAEWTGFYFIYFKEQKNLLHLLLQLEIFLFMLLLRSRIECAGLRNYSLSHCIVFFLDSLQFLPSMGRMEPLVLTLTAIHSCISQQFRMVLTLNQAPNRSKLTFLTITNVYQIIQQLLILPLDLP